MRSKNKIGVRIIGVLAVIVTILALVSVGFDIVPRIKLSNEFKPTTKRNPYTERQALSEIDLEYLKTECDMIVDAIALQGGLVVVIPAPVEINYYATPDRDTAAVYTIRKGEDIKINLDNSFFSAENIGYGLVSFPDYQADWRFAKPFLSKSNSSATPDRELYVAYDDLFAVADAFIAANDRIYHNYHYGIFFLKRKTIEKITHYVDARLHQHGFFLSPALLGPWLRTHTIILVALAFALLFTWLIASKRAKKSPV